MLEPEPFEPELFELEPFEPPTLDGIATAFHFDRRR